MAPTRTALGEPATVSWGTPRTTLQRATRTAPGATPTESLETGTQYKALVTSSVMSSESDRNLQIERFSVAYYLGWIDFDYMSEREVLEAIKGFISSDDEGFAKTDFKSSNLLIQILRESASKEGLREKTEELTSRENEVQELVEEISSVYSSELDTVLSSPKLYGVELEYLRSNITTAKKKVSQTKQYLQKNEKNIEQLNFNSVFNKLIYNRLKAVETEVSRFQLASSYLKSKRFLDCALAIPVGEEKSLLELNIRHKAEDLKNELSLAICVEMYSFCFLTGNVLLPTHNTVLERIKENRGEWDLHESIPNMEDHLQLYQKYSLLKSIDVKLYVKTLWRFADFDNKTGKIGVLHDAVRAAFNIARAQKLKEFIYLNVKKATSNIYLLVSIFQIHDWKVSPPSSDSLKPRVSSMPESFFEQCEFTNPDKLKRVVEFFDASLALGIIVIRKLILVEMEYREFKLEEYQTDFKAFLTHILAEVEKSVTDVFYSKAIKEEGEDNANPLRTFVTKFYVEEMKASLLVLGCQLDRLRSCIQLAVENLIVVEEVDMNEDREKIEQLKSFRDSVYSQFLRQHESHFHQDLLGRWIAHIQKLLGAMGGRLFSPLFFNQFEEIVFLTPMHKKLGVSSSLELVPSFVSEDKKEYIREFVMVCFSAEELLRYFKPLPLSVQEMHRLILTLLIAFQSRVITFCRKSYLLAQTNPAQLEQQRGDKKIREQEQKFTSRYSNVLRRTTEQKKPPVTLRRKAMELSVQQNSSLFNEYKVIEKMKVVMRFIEYFIAFFNDCLGEFLKGVDPNQQEELFEKRLQCFEGINFEESLVSKLKGIWEFCGREESNHKQIYLAVFKRICKMLFLLRVRQRVS